MIGGRERGRTRKKRLVGGEEHGGRACLVGDGLYLGCKCPACGCAGVRRVVLGKWITLSGGVSGREEDERGSWHWKRFGLMKVLLRTRPARLEDPLRREEGDLWWRVRSTQPGRRSDPWYQEVEKSWRNKERWWTQRGDTTKFSVHCRRRRQLPRRQPAPIPGTIKLIN